MKKRAILTLSISSILIFSLLPPSESLLQTAGPLIYQLEPGETLTQQWGLQDVKSPETITVALTIEGEGSEFVTFPETVDLPPGLLIMSDITVTIPEDHPTDVLYEPKIRAKSSGESGVVIVNISMTKVLTILIGNPVIEEEEVVTPTVETPTVTETPEVEEAPEFGESFSIQEEEEGGGCLIATATYGSEMASQVQMLREIRDNKLLLTESGTLFMTSFNSIYYSFSPTIADLERENSSFKEFVKIVITPLLTTLSILNYIDIDSEIDMLATGISLILLNVGIYFVAPAIIITKLHRKLK